MKLTIFFLLCSYLPARLLFSSTSALYLAVKEGNINGCKELLESGADVNHKVGKGRTPLHKAAEEGNIAIARLLIIQYKATVDAQDSRGYTPLHCAANAGHKNICSLLIENKAVVNQKSKRGDTPLHCAARCGHTATCLLLISHQADVNAKGGRCWFFFRWLFWGIKCTPFHWALKMGNEKTAELLLLYGVQLMMNPNLARKTLPFSGSNKVKNLIKKYMSGIKKGETPLHWAAEKGDQKAFFFLIKKGFNIYHITNEGKTVLDFAKDHAMINIIRPYERGKVTGYLRKFNPSNYAPTVIIDLILSFSSNKKMLSS